MFKREVKMSNKEKAEMKAEILKVTPNVVAPKKVKSAPVPKMSKKALQAVEVLKTMPSEWRGSNREKFMTGLLETVLGEKLVVSAPVADFLTGAPRIDKTNLKKFQAIVPEGHANEHNYPLGKTVLLLQDGGSVCLKADGTAGDAIRRSSCRYATRPEITAFLDELQKKGNVEEFARYF